MVDFAAKHAELLSRAIEAIAARTYWSPYPESPSPKVYGETAKDEQEAAFKALLGKPFEIPGHPSDQPAVGDEVSPYGPKLGVTYPSAKPKTLVEASIDAGEGWEEASPDVRAGVLLEIIERLNRQSFLIASAVSMTSGQAFMMAFQAGGPHAQDRALEAVAYALAEQRRVPAPARWEKPQGKGDPIRLDKEWRIVPRGVGLVIGCATFPTWNTYPGLFASLATGNSVIVKPHPQAILPAAISVRIAREVIAEAGFDPNLVLLAPDTAQKPVTMKLAAMDEIEIIDYTGSTQFGQWLRDNCGHKQLYLEEAGINAIAVTAAPNFRAMCDNIAFSLSLYSGQMCTAPQNIFVPKPVAFRHGSRATRALMRSADGDQGWRSTSLLGDPDRASRDPWRRCRTRCDARSASRAAAASLGRSFASLATVAIPSMRGARTATPDDCGCRSLRMTTMPIWRGALWPDCLHHSRRKTRARGGPGGLALSHAASAHGGDFGGALYSTDRRRSSARAIDACLRTRAGVTLSINLDRWRFRQPESAAFSDFHVDRRQSGRECQR